MEKPNSVCESDTLALNWPSGSDIVPPRVLSISGYKRTGKDTVAMEIGSGVFKLYNGWSVYCLPSQLDIPHIDVLKKFRSATMVSLAAGLTARVYKNLGWTLTDHPYEAWKERPIGNTGNTLRDLLKTEAARMRAIDQEYWTKTGMLPHFTMSGTPRNVICRDNRYADEIVALKRAGASVTSLRVYRSEIPIPLVSDTSEHSIDLFTADLLVVRNSDEFKKACGVWPVYRGYQQLGTVDQV